MVLAVLPRFQFGFGLFMKPFGKNDIGGQTEEWAPCLLSSGTMSKCNAVRHLFDLEYSMTFVWFANLCALLQALTRIECPA
jgi:hypothetical protein